jgi:hypothetical protein
MQAFNIIFPSDADTLEATGAFEAESRALVAKANVLAKRAESARGEYRALVEAQIKRLLWEACSHPGIYRGGAAPRIVVTEACA